MAEGVAGCDDMRHSLNWLLRLAVPESDRQAILGDLEEEYRSRVQPAQ
jgi:hypothetical protein